MLKEQFEERFTEQGSFKVYGTPDEVYEFFANYINDMLDDLEMEDRTRRCSDPECHTCFTDEDYGYNQAVNELRTKLNKYSGKIDGSLV